MYEGMDKLEYHDYFDKEFHHLQQTEAIKTNSHETEAESVHLDNGLSKKRKWCTVERTNKCFKVLNISV